MSNIKFALVGCGKIAKKHAQVLLNMEGVQLSSVCDINKERARNFAESVNVPWYSDYHEMLHKEDIDVVNILTPSGFHARDTIEIAKYKKHIVVEKPMALTLEDANLMINTCEENKVKLFVVKQNRYNMPVRRLKDALDRGRFGKLVLGTVRVRWCRGQGYYDEDRWRGTWALDGGVLANQAAHHIDMLTWMMGEVESVFTKTKTILVNIEAEDTGVVVLQFKNGALGVIEATTATRPKDIEGSISILGEYGSVEIGGFSADDLKIWRFQENIPEDIEIFKSHKKNPDEYAYAHKEFFKDVVNSIKTNEKFMVDGREGIKSLQLLHAIYVSSETNKEVYIGDEHPVSRLGIIV